MADKTLLRKNIISTEIFFLIVYATIILTGGDLSTLLIPALFNVVLIIIIFANANKNAQHVEIKEQKFFDDMGERMQDESQQGDYGAYQNNFAAGQTAAYSSQSQHGTMSEPVREDPYQYSEPEYAADEPREKAKIEISGLSEVPNTSFALTVDGRVCGYIGALTSTFDVPAGMHHVQILTNDVQRKVIFDKNVMFNTKKKFTVKKKFGGYSVIME